MFPARVVAPVLVAALSCACTVAPSQAEVALPQRVLLVDGEPAVPANAPELLAELHRRYADHDDGAPADYIPELAQVPADLFGIAIVGVDGTVVKIGDCDRGFTIQSVSKPFVLGLALGDKGREYIVSKVGVEPTGQPFNSMLPSELTRDRTQNPVVNAGAIATTSFIEGDSPSERFERVEDMFARLAGRPIELDAAVYESEMATNWRNMSIAWLLKNYGQLEGEVDDAVERYTRACSLSVSAESLAVMGATLAHGGVNPMTGDAIYEPGQVRDMLSVMAMAGMYDFSGEWMFRVGLPAKSGVGGGIVAVVPGRFAVATFAPRLDERGNSIRGQRVIEDLSAAWGLHLMGVERPAP